MTTELSDIIASVFVNGTITALARIVDWSNESRYRRSSRPAQPRMKPSHSRACWSTASTCFERFLGSSRFVLL